MSIPSEVPRLLSSIHRADDPQEAFRRLVDFFPRDSIRCAVWIEPALRIREIWPPTARVTSELLATALHLRSPEVFVLGPEFPADCGSFPECEVLSFPLKADGEQQGALLLLARRRTCPDDPDLWMAVGEALLLSGERHALATAAEQKARLLQQRVEESEALHTLGLAANRTLHPDEVLRLVARFARSLLGADYVTVSTSTQGRLYTEASVGLNDPEAADDDYWLARKVVDSEKPVIVGGPRAAAAVEEFPFHAAEGMQVGLGIPLSLYGESFGALIIGYRTEREITPRDMRFALTLAGHAAVAISNAHLHGTLQERSEKLEQAYEALSELSRAKERFFASVNHELRNPIGAILGYLSLVLDGTGGELPAGARAFLTKADRSARTLLDLVNDLLDLSKIAAGKMEMDPRRCTLAEILDGVLTTIEPLAAQKGVQVSVDPADSLPELVTDPHRVQQILVNLLSNAIKFTGDEGVRISASAHDRQTPSEDGWIDIRVTDAGPGLSPEDQALVFEEFEQVKGTRGGTGLGLPIARRLARMLGGDLLVESQVGVGSTFILRLPGSREAVEGAGRARSTGEASVGMIGET